MEVRSEDGIQPEEEQSKDFKVRKSVMHMVNDKAGDERKLTITFFHSGAIKIELQHLSNPSKSKSFFISKRTAFLIWKEFSQEKDNITF
jgi:hypothetical protein